MKSDPIDDGVLRLDRAPAALAETVLQAAE